MTLLNMELVADDAPQLAVAAETPKRPDGRAGLAIGFGLLCLSSLTGSPFPDLWPFLSISFAFSMAGLICAVGKFQGIFGVLLCGVTGGASLVGFLVDSGILW